MDNYLMAEQSAALRKDISTIAGIEAVPNILQVVCHATGMGFAAVARVTEGRWVACSVLDQIDFGLKPGGELKVETTICHEIRQSGQGVVIDNVGEDVVYCGHPTPAMYGFQSYISMPIIRRDGTMFGTLCAIDPKPHRLKVPGIVGMFKLFAELIAFHIDSTDRLALSEANLLDERMASELREQFIAVLGHDLRNPLASIRAGAHVLLSTPLDAKAKQTVAMMQNSVSRMTVLINDVLDFARSSLGGGFILHRDPNKPLQPVLEQVIAELRTAWPDHSVIAEFAIVEPVNCDRDRIAQLFSNVLGNAVKHGGKDTPVRVQASTGEGAFRLSVANSGPAIPPSTINRLFQPFTRGTRATNPQGLGLGLYIANEIARAHGGMLTASSSAAETRFTFQMPLRLT
jgi:signal transduction histidine kinase